MKLSTLLLAVFSLLVLLIAGCAEKPQEEATPAPGAAAPGAAPAPGDTSGSTAAPQGGELQRFKRP